MNLENLKKIGKVESVDTGTLIIKVEKEEYLNSLQVNNLVAVRSTKTGEKIIGLITKIMRKSSDKIDDDNPDEIIVENIVKVILVGTFLEKSGTKKNVFKRTLETVPSIDADCFLLEGDELSKFMNSLTYEQDSAGSLNIGKYTFTPQSLSLIHI
jgi:hypothetical protein